MVTQIDEARAKRASDTSTLGKRKQNRCFGSTRAAHHRMATERVAWASGRVEFVIIH